MKYKGVKSYININYKRLDVRMEQFKFSLRCLSMVDHSGHSAK